MNKKENLIEATVKALYEDEIEGQISFDDMEKDAEEEKKGKFVYETNFSLDCPVNDYEEAYNYLTEDDMIQYLDKDRCSAVDDIKSIEWILEDNDSGKIVVRVVRELTEEELDQVSDWISGQNSDGLGEGFEQQGFAESYFNPVTGDGPYTRREVEREIERLYEDIDINELADDGYLENEIWEAVEVYKDENNNYDEDEDNDELDDDEIYDIIVSDIYSYIDEEDIEAAKQEYIRGNEEFNEDDWYHMASFDWQHNKYKLRRVK